MPAQTIDDATLDPRLDVRSLCAAPVLAPVGRVDLDSVAARNDGRGRSIRPRWSKRLPDVALASIGLVALAPLLLLVGLLIRLESDGPALYRQTRRGQFGKPFRVYKFRSMRNDASAPYRQATVGDSRVTRLGALLRRTSIDELPQLINVLEGSMSLIGPRPHPIELDNAFVHQVPDLMARYEVQPGLSGLAQVTGHRGETRDAEAMRARVSQDLRYIEQWSPTLDLQIVALTILRVWRDRNAY